MKIQKTIKYLIYLFFFLLPLQTRWIAKEGFLNEGIWEYGRFSLYGTDILLVVILFLFLIKIFKDRKKDSLPENIPTIWWIIAFLELAVFISIFFGEDKSLAFYGWIKILEGIMLFWLISKIKPSFKKIAISLGLAGLIQVALSLNQFFTQKVFASKWLGMASQNPQDPGVSIIEFGLERWLRAYGSFSHPNMLGGFLAITIIFLFGLYLKNSKSLNKKWSAKLRKYNILILAVIAINTIGIFFSFSRSAWLAFFIGIILIFIFSRKNKRFLRIEIVKCAGVIALIFLSLVFMFSDLVLTRFNLNKRLEQKSFHQRIDHNNQAFQIIKNNWHKGVGINNYTLAVHNQIDNKKESWFYQPVHNIYLLIISELGIVGFIIFSSFVGYVLLSFPRKRESTRDMNSMDFRFRGNDKREEVQTKIIFISLVMILIIGLFDHYFWTLHSEILLFWGILGIYYLNLEQE